ncbi:hypothetical protein GGX14DRAFT_397548 [Mycena pura]|uniref:Uncharacterized protein n=1 Tax=Mycena pura TaxID=153505 RepID=A0AAD6VF46_9AGAR|nr:hypothetical protein GGX14DRAFT_397548 [Mycena pura]
MRAIFRPELPEISAIRGRETENSSRPARPQDSTYLQPLHRLLHLQPRAAAASSAISAGRYSFYRSVVQRYLALRPPACTAPPRRATSYTLRPLSHSTPPRDAFVCARVSPYDSHTWLPLPRAVKSSHSRFDLSERVWDTKRPPNASYLDLRQLPPLPPTAVVVDAASPSYRVTVAEQAKLLFKKGPVPAGVQLVDWPERPQHLSQPTTAQKRGLSPPKSPSRRKGKENSRPPAKKAFRLYSAVESSKVVAALPLMGNDNRRYQINTCMISAARFPDHVPLAGRRLPHRAALNRLHPPKTTRRLSACVSPHPVRPILRLLPHHEQLPRNTSADRSLRLRRTTNTTRRASPATCATAAAAIFLRARHLHLLPTRGDHLLCCPTLNT